MATAKDKIADIALSLLKDHPEGIGHADLVRMILEADSGLKYTTIRANIQALPEDKFYRPTRGLYRLTEYRGESEGAGQLKQQASRSKTKESDFYEPFAEWIVDLGECTAASPLGGSILPGMWSTPDVIGKREDEKRVIVESPTEIISAEIKTDTSQLMTAFGQACSYRLFSHRSYLVIPRQSDLEELGRLDSLCVISGIGLVLFDSGNPDDPRFEIRNRAEKREPDNFFVNDYMERLVHVTDLFE